MVAVGDGPVPGPGGGRVYVVATVAPVLAGSPQAGLRWVLRDVTRRKAVEETLQAEKEFTDSLVETAEAVVLVLDQAGRIVRTNPYLRHLTGYEPGELEGELVTEILVPGDRGSVRDQLDRLSLGALTARGVLGLRTKDGRVRALAWSSRALGGGKNGRGLVLLVGNDVTDLQEAQRRALQAERLAAIGQMAAGLAHESRNALQRSQACLTRLGFRLEGRPEELDLLRRAEQAQEDLHRLYEEVREYAAPLRLELSECDLAQTWRRAWDELGPLRESTAAELREEVTGDVRCEGSPFHLRQVFRNLLENALGAVGVGARVTVRCEPAALDRRPAVRVAVEDNGPGFPEAERQKAFEGFFTTKVRGTGLGLAICKRIVEAHGGRIALGDAPPPGGVVVLTLPRRQG